MWEYLPKKIKDSLNLFLAGSVIGMVSILALIGSIILKFRIISIAGAGVLIISWFLIFVGMCIGTDYVIFFLNI